ncbi:hypothetical protein [Burkholderia cenocepacia]|uniref:hypothetical protein n=1 Tax=Burkholderia cenocepacia TaxID=95486 RepID=UPI0011B1E5DD|nr:hypothetical protein [Burkholderia cenocepacia]
MMADGEHKSDEIERFRTSAAEAREEASKLAFSLYEESERACVILGAAKIDSDLEVLLRQVLHPCAGGQDNLFESDRALGTFSAKISLAHRMGLISPEFERALQILRRVRNSFAHQVEDASLSVGGHKDRIAEIYKWASDDSTYDLLVERLLPAGTKKSREQARFVICILHMVLVLKVGANRFGRLKLGTPL